MVVIASRAIKAYKKLSLITPPFAEALLDRAVEGPVFISPYVREENNCLHCDVKWTPLVYTRGERTRAQHMHAPYSGGIYVVTYRPVGFGDAAHWVSHGTLFDPFEVEGHITLGSSFLLEDGPVPIAGAGKLYEHMGQIVTELPGEFTEPIGTVDDEGNMSFPLETWQRWVKENNDNT